MLAAPGSTAGAQIQIAPVAVVAIGEATTDSDTGVTTVQLVGSASFDPDPGGGIATYRWEVVTESYQWLDIDNDESATASFKVPSAELANRYGPSIEFRLTVTDSGTQPASATATVQYNFNRSPIADITVTAKLPAPRGEEFPFYDDDGDGEVDENDERYTREGVIHGPGEGGNADFEWDIREGSLLVVDGSGSSDADGPLPASAFRWQRLTALHVPATTADGITGNLPGDTNGQEALSTDGNPEEVGNSETVGRLTYARGQQADPYYLLYYRLTLTDEDGAADSAVVKIVIRDAHEFPTVEISHPESDPQALTDAAKLDGVLAAGENRYVISTEAAANGVTLTAVGSGDGSGRTRELEHTWRGVGVEPSRSNLPGSTTTAVFTAPDGTVEGDSFVVQVEVVDPSQFSGLTSVELVVADTQAPVAIAPDDFDTPDGIDGGFPVADPPTGIVRLRGIGFDADGDDLSYEWEQVLNADGDPLDVTFRGSRLSLVDSTTPDTSFKLPEVTRGSQERVYVQFKVTDKWGVPDTDVVIITLRDGDDDLRAIAGATGRVAPGGFVRLYGRFSSGLVSPDVIASVVPTWAYVGIETHPRTERRIPITDAEKDQGYVFGEWFPHDGLDENGNADPNEAVGTYSPDAGGRVKFANKAYPYFDAPELGEFNSIKLIFELTVRVNGTADTDTVVVVVAGPFFSGVVDGPDYCANLSLGGPTTYPLDSDGDEVADTCALPETRRATVARQNALETLAVLNPDELIAFLHGHLDDPETTDIDETTKGACASAPDDLGDTAAELAGDVCGRAGQKELAEREPSPLLTAVDPQSAAKFFSGVITGPSFCTNLSLGGPTTYAFDSDDDGVADTCALPYTRREAIARQRALEAAFADHPQFKAALAAACTALGTLDFGDSAKALAQDACSKPPTEDSQKGDPLPSPSG